MSISSDLLDGSQIVAPPSSADQLDAKVDALMDVFILRFLDVQNDLTRELEVLVAEANRSGVAPHLFAASIMTGYKKLYGALNQ